MSSLPYRLEPTEGYTRYKMTAMLRDYLGMVMEQPENAPYVQQVLSMLEGYTNQLKQLKTINRFETVKEVYKAVDGFFDKAPEETKKNIQCKAGCTACCFIDLDISREEAALIVNYCRENDIEIDKEYLTKQVSIGRRPSNGMSRCVFLKDNLCSIYPVRPVSCRKHFVNSDPALCDASKNAVDKVDRYFDINSEILASALLNVDVTEKLEAALLGELEKAAAV